ncbi:MAG: LLM class F420-dependent oxidoreductase [Streptomycetales bacterium]
MKFGISTFVTDEGIAAGELARAIEERGLDSLWVAEHTHIPLHLETPWPGGVPRRYMRTLDPFLTLAAAAATTERLLLCTGICLLIQRDPITTAKEVASLDQLSHGRAVFGVGAGWRLEEMRNHGTDPATRMRLLGERVAAIKAIWANEEAEFHGRHVDFGPIRQWPKPVQRPHPPVVFGGEGPAAIRLLLEQGDGWLPRAMVGPDRLREQIADVGRRARERGRDAPPVTVYGAPADQETVETYAALGVQRLLFFLPTLPADQTLHALDAMAGLAATAPESAPDSAP